MIKKPNLLILEGLPTISGGQQVLLDMIPAMQAIGNLSAMLPDTGPLAEALQKQFIPCSLAPLGTYTLVKKTPKDVFNYILRLPWLTHITWQKIRKEAIDLVYANSARTFVWGSLAAALTKRPIIWHHHNLLADKKTLALLRTVGRLPAVQRIICVSEEARQQFPNLKDKTIVIPNGVDTDKFRPLPSLGAKIRQELGIPPESHVVGLVGDIIELKGQQTLLEAVTTLYPKIYCLIVGDSRPNDATSAAYAQRLKKMAGEKIIFTGRRKDLPAVLNALDLLVIASERETGPLVLLEGLACGTPVLSTPVGRAPNLLAKEALFPIGDATALSKRLQSWLNDPPKLLDAKTAARDLACSRASLEQFRSRVQAEIKNVLTQSI